MSSSGSIVKLDIGGTAFKTSRSTLTRFDGFFKTMVETDVPVTKDESGAIFIDRDPKYFRLILNYMRDGYVAIPKSEEDIQEIKNEAQYYLLTGLVELCNVSKGPPIIKNDKHLFQVTTNPEKPVVIINYRSENWGDAFHSTTAIAFVEKHKNQFDVYFKPLNNEGTYWSHSIFDKQPNEYARTTTSAPSTFISMLECVMSNYLKRGT